MSKQNKKSKYIKPGNENNIVKQPKEVLTDNNNEVVDNNKNNLPGDCLGK